MTTPRKNLWGKAKGVNDAKGALLKAIEQKKQNGSQSPRHNSPGKRRPEAVVKRLFLSTLEKNCIMSGVVKRGVIPLKIKIKMRDLLTNWYRSLLVHHGIDPRLIGDKKGSNWFW